MWNRTAFYRVEDHKMSRVWIHDQVAAETYKSFLEN